MKNLIAVIRKIGKQYSFEVFNPTLELEKKEIITDKVEDKIYFDFEDIQRIIDYKATTDYLKDIKLIFLTLLFSGARYSDVHKVIPNNDYKKSGTNFRYAHFITIKNPTEVVVPFVEPLENAWEEYDKETFPKMSNMKFNEGVKELCQKVGFTKMKKLIYTNSNGEKEFDEKPHYKFVSSHIGRRSFITNFINVVSPTLITRITGHQFKMKEVVFKYNKITPLKSAVLFMKFAKKLYDDEDWRDVFPIRLIS